MSDATVNADSLASLRPAYFDYDLKTSTSRALGSMVMLFAAAMFAASGLLFIVEPMFARLVLPRLGGSPSVWNACVLFFQTMLLLGYLYAHLSTKWLGVKRQAGWHALLLLLPLLFLPITVGPAAPAGGQSPEWWLLQRMAVTVGVPFFVLATSAPLLQRWFAAVPHPSARDPYFLYGASNLGSLLALLGYPFLIEPALGLVSQARLWTAGYVLFAASIGLCILTVRRYARSDEYHEISRPEAVSPPISRRQRVRWVVLSFAPSSLMLGVTAHISTDIAAVPLLWVLPLAIYLLTFVLAFSRRGAAVHAWWITLAPPLVLACLTGIILNGNAWWVTPLHLVTFFACGMACHRQLAEARPTVDHLTAFYLWVSFGGMLGGVFNTLVAPHVFSTVLEYPLMLAFVCVLLPVRWTATGVRPALVVGGYAILALCAVAWVVGNPSEGAARGVLAAALGISVSLATTQGTGIFRVFSLVAMGIIALGSPLSGATPLFTGRSFFGVMRVTEARDHTHRTLRHGSTMHGWQQLPAADRCEPSSYYHPEGPVGDLVRAVGPRLHDVGLVGLGTGAMACYAVSGQRWTFYEIDPLVERIARDASLFTHLKNGKGEVDVVIGDGRITLQDARTGQYDMLVLDAFSSDAIPVHLLTLEAMQLYTSRLKEDGILAVHISNRYLALEPVVAALAEHERLYALVKSDGEISESSRARGRTAAQWMVLSRRPEAIAKLAAEAAWRLPDNLARASIWTDDYSNIFSVLR